MLSYKEQNNPGTSHQVAPQDVTESVAGEALENQRSNLPSEAESELQRHQRENQKHLQEYQLDVQRYLSEVQNEVQCQQVCE